MLLVQPESLTLKSLLFFRHIFLCFQKKRELKDLPSARMGEELEFLKH